MPVMSIDEYLKSHARLKVCLEGPPGAGKTILASSVTRLGRTLYVDFEGGILSSLRFGVVNRENLQLFRPEPGEFGAETWTPQAVRKFEEQLVKMIHGGSTKKPYEFVVIDSISEVGSRLEENYAAKTDVPTIKDWQVIIERVQTFCRTMRDLPVHFICTVLTNSKDSGDGDTTMQVALPGKSRTTVPSYFHATLLLKAEKVATTRKHYCYASAPGIANVRDRYRALEDKTEISQEHPETIFEKLLEALDSEIKSAKAELEEERTEKPEKPARLVKLIRR